MCKRTVYFLESKLKNLVFELTLKMSSFAEDEANDFKDNMLLRTQLRQNEYLWNPNAVSDGHDKDNKEILIEEVNKHECLWNPVAEGYSDNIIRSRAWETVGAVTNLHPKQALFCWKKLRDSFARAHKKLREDKLFGKPKKEPRFHYYKQMLFLKNCVTTIGSNSTIRQPIGGDSSEEESSNDFDYLLSSNEVTEMHSNTIPLDDISYATTLNQNGTAALKHTFDAEQEDIGEDQELEPNSSNCRNKKAKLSSLDAKNEMSSNILDATKNEIGFNKILGAVYEQREILSRIVEKMLASPVAEQQRKDGLDFYAASVAARLREMSLAARTRCRIKIDKILGDEEIAQIEAASK